MLSASTRCALSCLGECIVSAAITLFMSTNGDTQIFEQSESQVRLHEERLLCTLLRVPFVQAVEDLRSVAGWQLLWLPCPTLEEGGMLACRTSERGHNPAFDGQQASIHHAVRSAAALNGVGICKVQHMMI